MKNHLIDTGRALSVLPISSVVVVVVVVVAAAVLTFRDLFGELVCKLGSNCLGSFMDWFIGVVKIVFVLCGLFGK